MKPRVRVCRANHYEYPFNAVVFVPNEAGAYRRCDTSVRWYHTVRATTLEHLCKGVTEALAFAPKEYAAT
jgi:hypothetical protein